MLLRARLRAGADPEAKDAQGYTALIIASAASKEALATRLLEAGAVVSTSRASSGELAVNLHLIRSLRYCSLMNMMSESFFVYLD